MKAILSVLCLTLFCGSAFADPLPILIVSGMKSEADLVRGTGIVNVIGAGNPVTLRQQLSAYDSSKVRAVVSFGVAGGLDPNLKPGDLVIPDEVVADQARWNADPSLNATIRSMLAKAKVATGTGSIYGSDQVKGTDPASRAEIFKDFGAEGVDNESHIVAEFAAANGLPFIVVRAIGDPASFTLPPAALLPLNPDGTPNNSAIMNSIKSDPSQLSALMQLRDDLNAATATLQSAQGAIGFATLEPQTAVSLLSAVKF